MSTFKKISRTVAAATPRRSRAMPRAVRFLAFAMAASAAMQGSYVAPAHAAASDITESAAPVFGAAPAASAAMADGDASVSGQTGSFNYSYPIVTPPGRQGMAPKLGLSYSSQGGIYGTLAAGWNLTIPDIHEDTSQGRLATHHSLVESTQTDRRADDRFTSSMAGGRPFVKVTEPKDASVYGTYRARSDSSYTRYQRMESTAAFRWRALTTDGSVHEFGGASASACSTVVSEGYAPLTRSLDQWNNSITYNYAWDADTGECRIDTITYGANSGANRPDFAKVTFDYNSPMKCPGAGVSIGAQTDWRSGTKIVTGARSVYRLLIESRPGGLSNAAVHTRTISFLYAVPGYNGGLMGDGSQATCNGQNSPYRALQSIQETVTGTGLAPVTLPAVTFDYGTSVIDRSAGASIAILGLGSRAENGGSSRRPGVTYMWTDMNGDGRQDLLTAATDAVDGNGYITKCRATWYPSGNTSQSNSIDLPMLPWGGSVGKGLPKDCTLNYQFAGLGNYGQTANNYLNYRWLDANGDGRTDLVATLETVTSVGLFWPELLSDLGGQLPFGLPPHPVNSSGARACPNPPAAPALCARLNATCTVNPSQGCLVGGICGMNMANMSMCIAGNRACAMDEGWYAASTPPAWLDDPYNGPYAHDHPFQRCGLYPWFVFGNTVDTNGVTTLATNATIKWQPVGLDSEQPDDSLGGLNSGSRKSVMDLDGDGLFDGFNVGTADTATGAWWWNTFVNDGTGTLNQTNFMFRSSDGTNIHNSDFIKGASMETLNELERDLLTTSGLIDINGDGLPDFVSRRIPAGSTSYSTPVNVAWNDGTSIRLKKYADGVRGEFDLPTSIFSMGRQRVDGTYVPGNSGKHGSPGYFSTGDKYTMERLLDVDGDGRVDLLSQGNAITNPLMVSYNLGGTFKAPVPMLGVGITASQRVRVNLGDWFITADFIDLDGDGLVEYYKSPSTTSSTTWGYRHDPAGKPPRLLHTIRNGYGATTAVTYASMQDVNTVVQGGATVSPKAQWVVKSVTNTDDFTQTSEVVGSPAYAATTTYKYIGPRYAPDDEGRYGFRGFNEVQTFGASGAATIAKYGYNVDWSGRQIATIVVPVVGSGISASTLVSSVSTTEYQAFTMFSGALVTYHPVISRSFVCTNTQTEDTCSKSGIPAAFTKTVTTMAPATIGAITTPAGGSPGLQLGWVPTSTRLQGAGTAGDGDRLSEQDFYLLADANNYRMRPTRSEKYFISGGGKSKLARSLIGWDATYKQALTSTVWFDSGSSSATSSTEYDAFTGNVKSTKNPIQQAGGLKTTFAYDADKLFVTDEVNELGHKMQYEWEPGTGSKVATIGPNDRTCITACPPITPTSPERAREERRITIDALGRTVESKETASDQGESYTLYTVGTATYSNPDLVASPKVPSKTLQQSLLTIGGTVWIKGLSETDGHGRPLRTISYSQGAAPFDAITSYTFASDGKRNTVAMPDPTLNSAATVRYVYLFDSLGRAKQLLRPDATAELDRSGAKISYDGVTTTTEEVLGLAGGTASKKIAIADTFGRLVQLKERSVVGASAGGDVYQTTNYTYAPDDTMAKIEDPEGVKTLLTHDFAGRRTTIERAGRKWKYSYDLNGNVISELVPGSTGPLDVAQFTTTMTYDALDRVATKMLAPRSMTPADVALFGTYKTKYTWDYGAQRKGRLRYTQAFGAATGTGSTTATVSTDLQYDAWGNNTFTNHTFNGAGFTGLTRQFGRRYQVGGREVLTNYRDYVAGGANETTATTDYDARGLPLQVKLSRTGITTQTVAVQTRNVAGLVTKRRTDQLAATGTMPWIESNWNYDVLARVTSQTVQKGSVGGGATATQVARQQLAYTGSDDPTSLVHTMGPTTAPNVRNLAFTYDARHQLERATTTTGTAFDAKYTFGPAGRFTNVNITQTTGALPNGNDVQPRNVNYVYGGPDPEQVTALTNVSNGTAYASYVYDAAGNQTQRVMGGVAWDYLYDGEDRLRRVTKRSVVTPPTVPVVYGIEEYWYDENGARVGVLKRNGSGMVQELIWFIGDTQAHYSAAGVVTKAYSHLSLGTPVARVERNGSATTATNVEYQFHGMASNTLAAVATDGTVNANVVYAPYGEVLEAQEGAGSVFGLAGHRRRFNDKYVDEIGGLGYYGARYYDNVLLGWTQADPKYRVAPDAAWTEPRRASLYAFVMGNPVRYLDPDGRDSMTDHCTTLDRVGLPKGPTSEAGIDAMEKLVDGMLDKLFSSNGSMIAGQMDAAPGFIGGLTSLFKDLGVVNKVSKKDEAIYRKKLRDFLVKSPLARLQFSRALQGNGTNSSKGMLIFTKKGETKVGFGNGTYAIFFNINAKASIDVYKTGQGIVQEQQDAGASLFHELCHVDRFNRGNRHSDADYEELATTVRSAPSSKSVAKLNLTNLTENDYRIEQCMSMRPYYERD